MLYGLKTELKISRMPWMYGQSQKLSIRRCSYRVQVCGGLNEGGRNRIHVLFLGLMKLPFGRLVVPGATETWRAFRNHPVCNTKISVRRLMTRNLMDLCLAYDRGFNNYQYYSGGGVYYRNSIIYPKTLFYSTLPVAGGGVVSRVNAPNRS